MSEKLNRDLFIDKLKGAAMFLVVWGHTIQYCVANDFYHNTVFIVIYSFHMPLFMAVSGYLYFFSINKRNLKELIIIRFDQLVIPLLIWSLPLLYVIHRNILITPLDWIKNYISFLPDLLWFIWALFLCSAILAFINKVFKDSLWIYFAAVVIIILLPDNYNLLYTKYMFPYFIGGYFVHKYNLKSRIVTLLSFIFFPVMLYYWKYEDYIYISQMNIYNIHNLYIDLYRYIIGFLGIVVFITILKWLPKTKLLEIIGRYSLGIYIISSFWLHIVHYIGLRYDYFMYNFIYTPLIAFIIIFICIAICMLFEKNKILNKYLLGK